MKICTQSARRTRRPPTTGQTAGKGKALSFSVLQFAVSFMAHYFPVLAAISGQQPPAAINPQAQVSGAMQVG